MPIGTVIVNFWGICTFMTRNQVGIPDSVAWGNRYVLVNASNPPTINDNIHLAGKGISQHFAQLQISAYDILTMTDTDLPGFTTTFPINIPQRLQSPFVAWDLNNVLLSIGNAVPGASTPTPAFPNLSSFVEGPLPPPAEDMTLNTIPTRAAAFFDFFSGDLVCVSAAGGGSIGQLTVQTLGNPVIRVHTFETQSSIATIELRDGAEVVVGNGPRTLEEDKADDFRLHYLTCSTFPKVVGGPGPSSCPRIQTYNPPWWDPDMMVTPGCSNSNYP
ncbi:MAG TPA: hypothetical protein VKB93_27610 [Thermoanaerobaculia bacterium]|nr:hypothetical protein [Thermoanaerobaculia bacterium]